MNRRTFIFALVISLVGMIFTGIALGETRSIAVGGITTFTAMPEMKVTVGNSKVIRAEAAQGDSMLIIRGVGAGVSDITITYPDGRVESHTIRVSGGGGGRGAANAFEVQELLKNVKGIEIYQAGPRVVIDGKILSEDDAKRIEKVATEVFPGGIVIMASTDHQIMKQADNLMIEFHLVEVRKGAGGQLGMRWGQLLSSTSVDIGGGTATGARPSGSMSVHAGVDRFLQAMKKDGFGKIHDVNTIITANGKEAHYLVGGEVGFRVVSREAANVIYKVYGTDITVTPVMDKAGNVRMTIKAEISSLAGMTNDGVPNLTKNNITNEIQMKEGQTLVLSGMVSKVGNEEIEKLPGLGQVPGLGSLFNSKDFQKGESEAVIFVTAKRIRPDDRENIEMIKNPQIRFEEIDKNWWERR